MMSNNHVHQIGVRRQFENTILNQWKKFLLLIGRKGAEHYQNYWKSLPRHLQTHNTVELIQFVERYLADVPLWNNQGGMVPAEFNLDSYQNVVTNIG